MPLYEYECTACRRHTEKIQKFSDAEITECPHCGGKLERVLSAPAISFKGGGWYKDLYSSAKPAKAASENGDSSPKSDKPAGSEAAPASAASGGTPAAAPASAPAPAAASAASSSSKE